MDADGIGTILINQVNEPANLYSFDFIRAFSEAAQKAIADESVKGVIVTSARRIFMAGGDLRQLGGPIEDPKAFFEGIMHVHRLMRAVETGGKPFVAAIGGACLGGGMELALNCHHRIALNNPSVKLGFPESKVGLLPGGGGTVKAPYLMGIQTALGYLLQGTEARPAQALQDGLVDELADSVEEMMAKARKWIAENPKAVQPWDAKRAKIPGGGLMTPMGVQTMMGAVGNVIKMSHGNYPQLTYILKVVHDSLQVPIDRALEIEARYFTKVCTSKEAKNIIRTGFFEMQKARKGKARPKNEPPYEVKKLGILGAGMMGAGIAYVSAKAGMEVVLKDVSVAQAEKGKDYSRKLLEKAIAKGRSTREKADALLSQIHPTENTADFAGCDLVIEAVFENPELKARVTQETEAVLGADKIFGSNTSTIPISLLAEAASRPQNFIGIHFFSPVEKMPLVEIIVGKKTSDRAIAAAVDYTVAIRKVPIVVNDRRGFFTSRCFGTFVNEGMFLLEEGVPAAMIEHVARKKGMPVGPLAVHDEVSLTLSMHVIESNPDAAKNPETMRALGILQKLVTEHGRTGKKDGKGFYEYPPEGKKRLWKGLAELFPPQPDKLDETTVAKRLMHRQALESFRCLDEGVLRTSADGDLGSVLGWGFPLYTGGALSYIDYVGIQQFVNDCDAFAEKFGGSRWEVPASLRALAAAGKSVHDFKADKKAVSA
ncbi:MAG: 3-hydroxyacyl-CoA dehydrogenase [Bacteroidetes bacterium]|nr:MAG: 3-hydroxyacyl-CoA dehydrogenase [Bacteroidota bacterium]